MSLSTAAEMQHSNNMKKLAQYMLKLKRTSAMHSSFGRRRSTSIVNGIGLRAILPRTLTKQIKSKSLTSTQQDRRRFAYQEFKSHTLTWQLKKQTASNLPSMPDADCLD